ncbi:MAG: hypothetical protein JXQ73_33295 [Phycisphaerae bacterium]|nr:hypothetical protein [Phycisphaerae bacterium]
MRRLPSILLLGLVALADRDASACTVFYACRGDVALAGNNEDWYKPSTRVWFVTGKGGQFGRAYFGLDDGVPQGGVNEKGLFFDWTAVPPREVARSGDKPKYQGRLIDKILAECATVKEALGVLDRYEVFVLSRAQLMLGDATGDSAIVESGGVIRKEGSFQVVTNFRQSKLGVRKPSCDRYKIAVKMLSECEAPSVEVFRQILAATHQEGTYPTIYSNIYDLKRGVVYLYHYHDFTQVVEIDVKKELAKGDHVCELPSLFPPNYAAMVYSKRASRTSEEIRRQGRRAYLEHKYRKYRPGSTP